MSVELVFGLIFVVLIVAILFFNRSSKSLDINQDGKVDLDDAKKAVENAAVGVEETVKKAVVKAKTTIGKSSAKTPAKRGRKPKKAE
jgi:hypothetical protein